MTIEGGCYCGAVRYRAEGDPMMRAQCHCRECQYIAGGTPNLVMGMPESGFSYTSGRRSRSGARTSRSPSRASSAPSAARTCSRVRPAFGAVMLKVGTLDDPSVFGGPQLAIYTIEKQAFHHVPPGITSFERFPGG